MSDIVITNDGGPVTITAPAQGPQGPAGTVTIGTVTTGAPGSGASVENVGTPQRAVLDIAIPRGNPGTNGAAATVAVGTVTTAAPGSSASVANSGTTNAAVLDFTIPRGNPGADGDDGASATVAVGTVTTGAAGSSASVTNVGTALAAILDFVIPRGNTGAAGSDGIFSAIASQAEAEAGTENTKGMTALRVGQAIAALAGGVPTGRMRPMFDDTAASGWLLMDDGSLGSASSGATHTGTTYQALFNKIYDKGNDTNCPIQTSAGGATTRAAQTNAATAWANNCRIFIPKILGRAAAGGWCRFGVDVARSRSNRR
ncbi:MAG TPA: hypothetical protein VNR39_12410 [Pseudolabrys sp.]|nr:hypothetical protein [Pseudolabrys sp.]